MSVKELSLNIARAAFGRPAPLVETKGEVSIFINKLYKNIVQRSIAKQVV